MEKEKINKNLERSTKRELIEEIEYLTAVTSEYKSKIEEQSKEIEDLKNTAKLTEEATEKLIRAQQEDITRLQIHIELLTDSQTRLVNSLASKYMEQDKE